MKKTLLFITALLLCSFAFAQEGEIIYQEFEPAIHYSFTCSNDGSSSIGGLYVPIDLDHNGEDDYLFHNNVEGVTCAMRMEFLPGGNVQNSSACRQKMAHEGDTLTNIVWGSYLPLPTFLTTGVHWIGVKWPREEGCCYGWIKTSLECFDTLWFGDPTRIEFYIHSMAFCTQPDYPLLVGQTSFDWDVLDDEVIPFATLHPNPTNGLVTIAGNDFKQAQIINALGQCVATVKSEGEQLTLDISNLPAGVYFVNVTDAEGRKCVRKVVKE